MRLATLRDDLPASVVVFFVALPLCLGIALASGAPLFAGLIAGVVGGLVVGSISGSPLGVSGPAAGLAVIVLGAIEELGYEAFLVAVVLAGALQVVLGVIKAGNLAHFFPSAVVKGMLAGIGVIIVLKQLPHAFGYDRDPEGDLAFVQPDGNTTLSSLWEMTEYILPGALALSLASLAILILWEKVLAPKSRIFQIFPGPLVAVALGIVYHMLTKDGESSWTLTADHLVSVPVVADPSEWGQLLTWPDWSGIGSSAVWIAGGTMAVVASLETLLCVSATDKLDPQKRKTPNNRELLAQGVGNMTSGLMGGLPVTQVIVRSSANIQSGGATKASAILHGLWLMIFVLLLPGLLNMIPLAVLAAVLLVVGFKLARPTLFKSMWKLGPDQFLPFIVTILGIVFTDLLMGIFIGMVFANAVILRRNYHNAHFLHIRESDSEDSRHRVEMTLSEEVSFLNKGAIVKALAELPNGSHVTIDLSRCVVRDHDIVEVIEDFREGASARDIEVKIIDKSPKAAVELVAA